MCTLKCSLLTPLAGYVYMHRCTCTCMCLSYWINTACTCGVALTEAAVGYKNNIILSMLCMYSCTVLWCSDIVFLIVFMIAYYTCTDVHVKM